MTFSELFELVTQRKLDLQAESGTARLLSKGLDKILPKLNEECFEVGLALQTQEPDDVALEVSQVFYYLVCLTVFLDEKFESISFEAPCAQSTQDRHDLSKRIMRASARVCHHPCASSMNGLIPLLNHSLNLAGVTQEKMFEYL